MKKGKRIITESDRQADLAKRQKAIVESFGTEFNKIKRLNEMGMGPMDSVKAVDWQVKNFGESMIISTSDGNTEEYFYTPHDEEMEMGYNAGSDDDTGTLLFVNADETLVALVDAYTPTRNPDNPDWQIDDVREIKPYGEMQRWLTEEGNEMNEGAPEAVYSVEFEDGTLVFVKASWAAVEELMRNRSSIKVRAFGMMSPEQINAEFGLSGEMVPYKEALMKTQLPDHVIGGVDW